MSICYLLHMKQRKKKKHDKKKTRFSNDAIFLKMGNEALGSGNFKAAVEFFSNVSQNSPNYGLACKGQGAALLRLEKLSEALPLLQMAHLASPKDPEILVDGADVARLIGNLNVAEDTYREARKLGAKGFQVDFGEASIFQERNQWLKAIDLWEELDGNYPNNPYVLHNLGRAWHELGETDKAASIMKKSVKLSGEINTLSALALLAPHAKSFNHTDVQEIRVKLGSRLKAKHGFSEAHQYRQQNKKKINIGYVSAFFHRRNWMKPVWALLNNHNREKFNVHLFADNSADKIDEKGGYELHHADKIYDVREMDNSDLFQLIKDAEIDVLVDLNSYSKLERLGLWAAKPAPVTIGWFNLYATSGLPGIEWLIGDEIVIKKQEEEFYTEKIARLKQSYLTFQVGYDTPDIEPINDDKPFTFGCLGSGYKITPEVRRAWIKLMQKTNGTRLIIRNQLLGEEAHKKWFLDFFLKEGIDPLRIILLGPAEHKEFLQTYGMIDIALDTFPYNGGTTTMEALWQGVPVVCFTGDRWITRTSATILHSADLRDFIGNDEEEYIEIATKWSEGKMKEKLKVLRSGMREKLQDSTICNGQGLAADFERIIFDILSQQNN